MVYYIDPGTGSMLFTVLIGIVTAGIYAIRNLIIKMRFFASGGKSKNTDEKTIPFAIFSDSKRYCNTFGPICDEFEKRGVHLVYMTASDDDPLLYKDYRFVECRFIGSGNKGFAKLNILKADVLLSTTPGLDVYQWKRSRDVKYYIHVFHAPGNATMYRMFGLDYYDAILLSGNYQSNQIRSLESLRGLPQKELVLAGLPYLDQLGKRLLESPKTILTERTVLLAPSWGSSSIFNRFGEQIIDSLINTGYKIIIRPHPQSFISEKELISKLQSKYPNSDKLEWNSDNDNFDVLNKSDILVSDFSGVIFDFALVFDKPIIYADTSIDKEQYDACWLEEEIWTVKALPKIGKQITKDNLEGIKEIIDDCISNEKYFVGRENLRSEMWINRNHSAEVITEYMLKRRNELIGKEEDK